MKLKKVPTKVLNKNQSTIFHFTQLCTWKMHYVINTLQKILRCYVI